MGCILCTDDGAEWVVDLRNTLLLDGNSQLKMMRYLSYSELIDHLIPVIVLAVNGVIIAHHPMQSHADLCTQRCSRQVSFLVLPPTAKEGQEGQWGDCRAQHRQLNIALGHQPCFGSPTD